MSDQTSAFARESISNGNPREQALIRRWWYERRGAQGRLIFEYFFEGRYADAVLFPDATVESQEEAGLDAPGRFPVKNTRIILCEAKRVLNPELVGQALVCRFFALRAGAEVIESIVFCEVAGSSMRQAAQSLGLRVVCFSD